MKALTAVALTVALAATAQAQGPGMGMGQRPQLPDHWMTLDSLTQAVGLTADQQGKVAVHYNALNDVLKQGAAKRAAARQRMGAGGPGGMADMTDEQRQAMRARMDSMRAELQPLQTQADEHYQAIRALLTADQQPKFDALAKPVVVPPMRPRPTGGE
jgi:hypothetical protein